MGSLLFMVADSPNDRIGPSSPVGTFATRLLAQALSRPAGVIAHCMQRACTFRCILTRWITTKVDTLDTRRKTMSITRCSHSSFPFLHLSSRRRAPSYLPPEPYHPPVLVEVGLDSTLIRAHQHVRRFDPCRACGPVPGRRRAGHRRPLRAWRSPNRSLCRST